MKTYKILAITAAIGVLGFLGNVQVQALDNDTSDISNYEIQKIQLRENTDSDDDEITFELRDRAEKMFKNDPRNLNLKTTETNYGNGLIIKNKNLQWNGELDLTNKPKQLVLHHIEASRPNSNIPVEDVHSWHLANGWSGIGYHFYINKNGEIFSGRPENAIGAHAKGFNTNSLGIAVEGKYGSETMNSIQKEAVIKLSKYLRQKYDIDDIKGHGELMPTDCPGKNYPLDEIRNSIRQEVIIDGDITTWKFIDKNWYYLNTWTGEKLTGWQFVNNEWYYMDSSGIMQTGWQLIDNEWYYLHENGSMQIGWQFLEGEWYYLHENGSMQTGWQFINNEWYYMDSNGVMQTGWIKISGKIYYLDSNGQMYKEGWHKIDNNWHYMFENGSLAQNEIIQGITIDANGIAKI
ncbi:MAG: N-acetylmuramoyl-L-alanine amidase [Sarcina sp.]